MKKIILIVFVAIATVSVSAQKFGVKAGLNLSSYYGADAEGSKTQVGFQVGGLYEMPLSGNLYLQPEAILSLKGARAAENGMEMQLKPFYVEVPVKLAYKLNLGVGKFTIALGPYAALGVAGKASVNMSGISVSTNLFTKESGQQQAILNRFDLGVTSAFGYELPSGLFFNLESSTGFLNVAENSKMNNSAVSLVAGFKF